MTIAETPTQRLLASQIRAVQTIVDHDGDVLVAGRLGDLAERLESPNVTLAIAFCGLFSAGKSSLINALCDTSELATGAVPTTAKVTTMVFHSDENDVLLMDTPGIDSTDEAHQQAMEAALHRADFVALVMDYQHVESEDNLEMARMLSDQGKPLILVVNQIDKHFDWELSFDDFRGRVERTFSDYDIPYRQIFYTTTRESESNQLELLKTFLRQLGMEAPSTVQSSMYVNVRDLILKHVEQMHETRMASAESSLLASVGMVPFDTPEGEDWLAERMAAIAELKGDAAAKLEPVRSTLESVRSEVARIIELAQISPYETTEKGRRYVESLKSDFRVGWLNSKEKTAREVEARLTSFLEDLRDRTQKYLLWPVQGRLREGLQDECWFASSWLDDIERMRVSLTEEQCLRLVNNGSLISEQYPYQYVKDVVASVKRDVLGQLNQRMDAWETDATNRLHDIVRAENAEELHRLEVEKDAISAWLNEVKAKMDDQSKLLDMVAEPDAMEDRK